VKAVVVTAPGKLAAETLPDPTPAPGELVLRVRACGICGTDLHLLGHGLLPAGSVMGHEFCGEVMESRGSWRAGDRVCALPVLSCGACARCRSGLGAYCAAGRALGFGAVPGAFAEYVAVSAQETVRLPPGVDDTLGALVEPLAVGLHAVNGGRLRQGESCVVVGAGPIGLAIALWARHFGASEVVVSETDAGRRVLAERVGATAVIDPGREPLAQRVAALLPDGPEVVFEAAGAPGLVQQALDLARFRGRVVVAGVGFAPEPIRPLDAMQKEASLHFVLAYEKDDFQYTVDLLEQGRIAPGAMVTDRIGLGAAPEAFEALRRPEGRGKVLVMPGL
jgi:(R,R)-butanediol dehydrogenase/meso-butanediol dehydrogenase/diacetyl reductase